MNQNKMMDLESRKIATVVFNVPSAVPRNDLLNNK
jgi:hypothetical protein